MDRDKLAASLEDIYSKCLPGSEWWPMADFVMTHFVPRVEQHVVAKNSSLGSIWIERERDCFRIRIGLGTHTAYGPLCTLEETALAQADILRRLVALVRAYEQAKAAKVEQTEAGPAEQIGQAMSDEDIAIALRNAWYGDEAPRFGFDKLDDGAKNAYLRQVAEARKLFAPAQPVPAKSAPMAEPMDTSATDAGWPSLEEVAGCLRGDAWSGGEAESDARAVLALFRARGWMPGERGKVMDVLRYFRDRAVEQRDGMMWVAKRDAFAIAAERLMVALGEALPRLIPDPEERPAPAAPAVSEEPTEDSVSRVYRELVETFGEPTTFHAGWVRQVSMMIPGGCTEQDAAAAIDAYARAALGAPLGSVDAPRIGPELPRQGRPEPDPQPWGKPDELDTAEPKASLMEDAQFELRDAKASLLEVRGRISAFDGGDRPMSPPVRLLKEELHLENRIRELESKITGMVDARDAAREDEPPKSDTEPAPPPEPAGWPSVSDFARALWVVSYGEGGRWEDVDERVRPVYVREAESLLSYLQSRGLVSPAEHERMMDERDTLRREVDRLTSLERDYRRSIDIPMDEVSPGKITARLDHAKAERDAIREQLTAERNANEQLQRELRSVRSNLDAATTDVSLLQDMYKRAVVERDATRFCMRDLKDSIEALIASWKGGA